MAKKPNIHILWEFIENPWGGGNQFLKALRDEFIKRNIYAQVPEKADIILFNSHQNLKKALKLKLAYPHKVFVHRIDGPLAYSRAEEGRLTDKKIFYCNRLIADGTIFQSKWSRSESINNGLKLSRFECCVNNAPDPNIFFCSEQKETNKISDRKIRLIATSWSSNPRKGFDIYHYLDENLDFERYSMTFVGNTDKPYKNINLIEPLPSIELAEILRAHDIFISASMVESCSNSFLEGLHCGLPALARNNSSHPEVLGSNGLLFEGRNDIIDKIEYMNENLDNFRKKLKVLHIEEIASMYIELFEQILNTVSEKQYFPKRVSLPTFYYSKIRLKTV